MEEPVKFSVRHGPVPHHRYHDGDYGDYDDDHDGGGDDDFEDDDGDDRDGKHYGHGKVKMSHHKIDQTCKASES